MALPSGEQGKTSVGMILLLGLLQLFNAAADPVNGGGGSAGVSVLETEIIDLLQELLIHDHSKAGFFCWHGSFLLTGVIMHKFRVSVKRLNSNT